jgi:hypothetical protein
LRYVAADGTEAPPRRGRLRTEGVRASRATPELLRRVGRGELPGMAEMLDESVDEDGGVRGASVREPEMPVWPQASRVTAERLRLAGRGESPGVAEMLDESVYKDRGVRSAMVREPEEASLAPSNSPAVLDLECSQCSPWAFD